jgi:isopenicillin N synthase-like dioxygenase
VILSDDKVKAAKHRVLQTNPVQKRRTTAVVFVAPDLDATLKRWWRKRAAVSGRRPF